MTDYLPPIVKKLIDTSDEDLLSEEAMEKSFQEFRKAILVAGIELPHNIRETYENLRSLEMMRRLKNAIHELKNSVETSNNRIAKLTWMLIMLTLITAGLILYQVLNLN